MSSPERFEAKIKFGPDQEVSLNEGTYAALHPFNRMVVPIIVFDADGSAARVIGSGFILRPGVVMTARHVIDDDRVLLDDLMKGRLGAGIVFVSDMLEPGKKTEPWSRVLNVEQIAMSEERGGHDLALLTTQVAMVGDKNVHAFSPSLSFKAPDAGSKIVALGYPDVPAEARSQALSAALVGKVMLGKLTAAQGTINEIHAPHLDTAMLSFPVMESDYPSPFGMSGGPVFHEDGYVCGVVTSAWEFHPDSNGGRVSYASLLAPALNLRLTLAGESVTLYDLLELDSVRSDKSHRLYARSDHS